MNASTIIQFDPTKHRWWRKPLVAFKGRSLPAELAILYIELTEDEKGVWMNSRGLMSGVVDLIEQSQGSRSTHKTCREALPSPVAEALRRMYKVAGVKRGGPDLVIWNLRTHQIRLVEVKNPHWDRPTAEQKMILKAAETAGVAAKIVEWEFLAVPSN
jgi:hypothetical protein